MQLFQWDDSEWVTIWFWKQEHTSLFFKCTMLQTIPIYDGIVALEPLIV